MFNKIVVIGLLLTGSAAFAAPSESDTRTFQSWSNSFELGSIRVKNAVTKTRTEADPNCTWPEGPVCSDIQVPTERTELVEVIVGYSDLSFPQNSDDRVEAVEFRLALSAFSAAELAQIRSAKGYKSIKLARQLLSLSEKKVKEPVREPIYGNCDSEQNCEIIGYENVITKFKEVTVSRK